MDKLTENKIAEYLKSQSRNKIVYYKNSFFDFAPVDIGNLLSQVIYKWNDDNKLSMKVSTELDDILKQAMINHNCYGKMLAISNIGILLEPNLKQDIRRLFEKHSNNNVLFVKWEGEIDNEYLYFLTKKNGIKIDIKNVSHITL